MPRRKAGLTVAVTGASGYLASRLISLLGDDERVGRILGFDVRAPLVTHPKLIFDEIDVRNDALQQRFAGVDAVVHLAFIMDPIHDENLMRDVNVNGSQNVFRCAGKAEVPKVVYTSSAVAYGAHPDNPIPITEDAPLRANLDFSYAAHKLEVEYVAREFRQEFPDVTLTIFRPAIVFGPGVDNAWSHMFEPPVFAAVKGYDLKLQFVHENDVARALHHAVINDLEGAYNLAPEGWLNLDQMLAHVGRRKIEVPEHLAFSAIERMWAMGWAEAPAGMVHYGMYPWVVDPSRLTATGFEFTKSVEETFAETAERLRETVRLGPKRYAKRDLARAGKVSVGVVGALVALKLARKALSR